MGFHEWKLHFFIQISQKFVLQGLIDNMPAFFEVKGMYLVPTGVDKSVYLTPAF